MMKVLKKTAVCKAVGSFCEFLYPPSKDIMDAYRSPDFPCLCVMGTT